MKSRGADAVFDYHDPDCAKKIRAYTNNGLKYVLDTISTPESNKICAESFPVESKEKLNFVALLPAETWPREDIEAQIILSYTTLGEAFTKWGRDFPAIKEHFEFGRMFWELSAKLLEQGKIIPHPVALRSGGLQGIPAG